MDIIILCLFLALIILCRDLSAETVPCGRFPSATKGFELCVYAYNSCSGVVIKTEPVEKDEPYDEDTEDSYVAIRRAKISEYHFLKTYPVPEPVKSIFNLPEFEFFN